MMGLRVILALAGAGLLAACDDGIPIRGPVAPGGPQAPFAVSTALRDRVVAATIANKVSDNCPFTYGLNEPAARAVFNEFTAEAGAQGYSRIADSELANAFAKPELEKQLLAFVRGVGVNPDDPQYWCKAGAHEVAAHSLIGQYLVVR